MISIHKSAIPERVARDWLIGKPKNKDIFIDMITTQAWSPIVWRGGVRKEKNFLKAYFAVIDVDNGMSLKEAINEKFADFDCLIGTTKSHGIKGDRFRVIFRLEKPIYDVNVWRATHEGLIEMFGADKSCKDGARWYYPCKEIVHDAMDRQGITVGHSKVEKCPDPQKTKLQNSTSTGSANIKYFIDYIKNPIEKGGKIGRNDGTYRFGLECVKFGIPYETALTICLNSGIVAKDFQKYQIERQLKHAYQK